MSHSESQLHRDPLVEELVEELRDRVAFLERELERRGMEADRYQQIVAGLTQANNQLSTRLRELEAPQVPPEASESVVEEPEGALGGPVSTGGPQAGYERPRDTAEFPMRGSLTRPWWRRMFGG
jgi:uncharacterized small protein (DUF1192 family)